MSRSNPTSNTPHPATRWFEWNGEQGNLRYYDADIENSASKTGKGKNVAVVLPFTFILLDELAVIRGWNEPSESGIISNEVRDTRAEPFVVKSFKGGKIAEGFYAFIRDRVAAAGGNFTSNCYIAWKDGEKLAIGSIRLKGAALSAWFEFRKEQRKNVVFVGEKKVSAIYAKAICIKSFVEGKKGSITFRKPVFALSEITDATNKQAVTLDKELQEYLTEYLKRTKVEAATPNPAELPQPNAPEDRQTPPEPQQREPEPEPEADDVPF